MVPPPADAPEGQPPQGWAAAAHTDFALRRGLILRSVCMEAGERLFKMGNRPHARGGPLTGCSKTVSTLSWRIHVQVGAPPCTELKRFWQYWFRRWCGALVVIEVKVCMKLADSIASSREKEEGRKRSECCFWTRRVTQSPLQCFFLRGPARIHWFCRHQVREIEGLGRHIPRFSLFSICWCFREPQLVHIMDARRSRRRTAMERRRCMMLEFVGEAPAARTPDDGPLTVRQSSNCWRTLSS